MPSKPSRASEKSVHPFRPLNPQGGPVYLNSSRQYAKPIPSPGEQVTDSSSAESHISVAAPPTAVATPTNNRQGRNDLPPIYSQSKSASRNEKRSSETSGPVVKKRRIAGPSSTSTPAVKRPTVTSKTTRPDDSSKSDEDIVILSQSIGRSGSNGKAPSGKAYERDEEEAAEPIEWDKVFLTTRPNGNPHSPLPTHAIGPPSPDSRANRDVQTKTYGSANRVRPPTMTAKVSAPIGQLVKHSSFRDTLIREPRQKKVGAADRTAPPAANDNPSHDTPPNAAGPSSSTTALNRETPNKKPGLPHRKSLSAGTKVVTGPSSTNRPSSNSPSTREGDPKKSRLAPGNSSSKDKGQVPIPLSTSAGPSSSTASSKRKTSDKTPGSAPPSFIPTRDGITVASPVSAVPPSSRNTPTRKLQSSESGSANQPIRPAEERNVSGSSKSAVRPPSSSNLRNPDLHNDKSVLSPRTALSTGKESTSALPNSSAGPASTSVSKTHNALTNTSSLPPRPTLPTANGSKSSLLNNAAGHSSTRASPIQQPQTKMVSQADPTTVPTPSTPTIPRRAESAPEPKSLADAENQPLQDLAIKILKGMIRERNAARPRTPSGEQGRGPMPPAELNRLGRVALLRAKEMMAEQGLRKRSTSASGSQVDGSALVRKETAPRMRNRPLLLKDTQSDMFTPISVSPKRKNREDRPFRSPVFLARNAPERRRKKARLGTGIALDALLAKRMNEEDSHTHRCLQPYLYLNSPSYLFERSTDGGETWLPLEHPEAHNHIIEVRGEDKSLRAALHVRFDLDRSTSYTWWTPNMNPKSITLSISRLKLSAKVDLFDTDGRWLISSEESQDVVMHGRRRDDDSILKLTLRKALRRSWFLSPWIKPPNIAVPPVSEPSLSPTPPRPHSPIEPQPAVVEPPLANDPPLGNDSPPMTIPPLETTNGHPHEPSNTQETSSTLTEIPLLADQTPIKEHATRHANRMALFAELLPALDQIYDGGKSRADLREHEDHNISAVLHIDDPHLVVAITWTRYTHEYGPMYFTDQTGYLKGYICQYGKFIIGHSAGNALKLHFTRLFQEGLLNPPTCEMEQGFKEALRVLIDVNKAWTQWCAPRGA